jgi:uncharacterized membrane protein YqhA
MEGAKFSETGVMWQTIIHITFILSAMGIAYIDYIGRLGETKTASHS